MKATGMNIARYSGGDVHMVLKLAPESVGDAFAAYDEMHDWPEIAVELSKPRKKRSLDANAYAWVLMDKLAEKTGIAKEDIYREAIRNIGGNNAPLCMPEKEVEVFCEIWHKNGLGWLTEVTDSKIDGCRVVFAYYGSSTYDTAQMARLIDRIVQDCKEQGIETMPPKELEALIEGWDKKHGRD